MYFSQTCNVEYIAVPKVACTSIKLALLESDGLAVRDLYHVHCHDRWQQKIVGQPKCRFSFVRHPFDRLASAYREKLQRGNAKSLGCPLPKTASMDDWVKWVTDQNPHKANAHWKPQVHILGRRRLDFLGRFEWLESDWEKLRVQYGLPALPVTNVSTGGPKESFSSASMDRLRRWYELDLTKFGYRTDEYQTYETVTKEAPSAKAPKPSGWLTDKEQNLLVGLAHERNVLEIGCWQGLSTSCIGQTAKSIVSVDWFRGDDYVAAVAGPTHHHDVMRTFFKNLEKYDLEAKVTTMVGDLRKVLPRLNVQDYDLIFYDADHGGPVLTFAMMWIANAKPECKLAIHDYKYIDKYDDLREQVDALARNTYRKIRVIGSLAVLETKK